MATESRSGGGVRLEGLSKVTGAARYVDDVTSEEFGERLHFATALGSPVARGRVRHIDERAARQVDGVIEILTHANAPRLRRFVSVSMAETGERLPLQDDRVTYWGEAVAVVVAKTRLAAQLGASKLKVTIDPDGGAVAVSLGTEAGQARLTPAKRAGIAPGRLTKGDAHGMYAASDEQIDMTVHTAPHHHNAMETSAVIAKWEPDGSLKLRTSSQWHHIEAMAVGRAFSMGIRDGFGAFLMRKLFGAEFQGKVQMQNHLSGGAFGRNLAPAHLFLACMAAKVSGVAVKLTLTREQTYTLMSYRSEVAQRVRIGASRDGKLRALIHDVDIAVGAAGKFVEPVGGSPFELYAHEAHALRTRIGKMDLNGAGWMRAPGNMSAAFAFESALDVLARRTRIAPVDLRLANETDIDPVSGKAYGQRALRLAYETGAARFGWSERPQGGTRTRTGLLRGFGVATCFEHAFRFPASAGVRLKADGRATLELTIAEMGQGAWTALHSVGAEALGLPGEDVTLCHDSTALPSGAGSIASTGTRSNVASILAAAAEVRKDLLAFVVTDKASAMFGLSPDAILVEDGWLIGPGNSRESVAAAMSRHPAGGIRHVATTGRDFGRSKIASASFGAIFAEVHVDPIVGTIRVPRLLGAFDCGRILQPRIVDAQLTGAMIWGLGTALMDETRVDTTRARWSNAEIGEALIPTIADCPDVRAITVHDPALSGDPMEMKGAAEVGLIGVAPAIANAVFDATGFRPTRLPIRTEHIADHFATGDAA